jgi:glycerophosphoryl diester phosphodiesterase
MALLNFNPPVIAHRGASAYAPENTLAAFTKAAQLGVKWVEFDVMLSADGEVIVFHDDSLDRTTNGKGEVVCYPYSYLRTLDVGAWFDARFAGEKIPSLQQVMALLSEARMSANVEIKAPLGQEKALVLRVLDQLSTYLLSGQSTILFSSFSMDALHLLRQHAPDCLLGMLLHEWEPHWEKNSALLKCDAIHVNQAIMTREHAQHIKHMGKPLLCYTVNDAARAQELYSWGVDAVFSDAPDIIMRE